MTARHRVPARARITPGSHPGAAPAAVAGDRLPNVYRQRQPVTPVVFAMNGELPGTPVHVIDAEHGYLFGS